jgi:uncharacterized membrane protein YeiH
MGGHANRKSEMSPLLLIEFVAVATSALYGVLRAARHGFDVVGVFCVAFVVAFGGGTLRDVLLDRHPVFWIAAPRLVWIVLAIALVGACVPGKFRPLERFLWLPDAVGLAMFSVLGATFALEAHAPPLVAVLLGVVTGTFGGVIADVMCNQMPTLFHKSPLYATCALAAASSYLVASHSIAGDNWPLIIGCAVGFALRVWAVLFDIHLPSRTLRD